MFFGILFLFVFYSLVAQVSSQICSGVSQYGRCSSNAACGCLHMEGAFGIGICGFQFVTCSELVSCGATDSYCPEPDQICVHHPRCNSLPVCYPASMMDQKLCPPMKTNNTSTTAIPTVATTPKPEFIPLRGSAVNISPNAQWEEDAVTVAESYQLPDGTNDTNRLYIPMSVFVTDDETLYVTDPNNNRVMEIKRGSVSGKVVAGGNGRGNGANQLSGPSDAIVDKDTDSLIICDNNNKRVVRWPRVNGIRGETIISNVSCHGLTMDQYGSIYTVGYDTHEVKRFLKGESEGTIVAGGNGRGSRLDQLNWPQYAYVDRDLSIYVSEWYNSRVTKWVQGAKEGIVVAGGQGQGSALTQLGAPIGVVVDQSEAVYAADGINRRVVRWSKGATQGVVVAGGNGQGKLPNQLAYPYGLSFDRNGNLYVVDHWNHRVQKFSIKQNA